jgi:hypothetical protein
MITITVSLWLVAAVCFALAVVLPFLTVNAGRLNLIALGLFCAALTHVLPWGAVR